MEGPAGDVERIERRRDTLTRHGASPAMLEELLEFNRPSIEPPAAGAVPGFPLDEEPHIAAWRGYAADAVDVGAWESLRRRFPQLQFPIQAGMRDDEGYRRATLRGEFPQTASPGALQLSRPEELELELYPAIAGVVPVLTAGARDDFVLLMRAFTARNEPVEVPASMGACLVSGLNNWDRIHSYRSGWEAADPAHREPGAWSAELRRLLPHRALYQDRFVILSRGPYSNVAAVELGIDDQEWLARSYRIRRAHECTHYFTLRVFGRLQHNVVDELIADLVGSIDGLGRYRGGEVLRFLGLESFPEPRAGGRLDNYRGSPPLPDEAFAVVRSLTHAAVRHLEGIVAARPEVKGDPAALARLVFALTSWSLEELAAEDAVERATTSA